MFVQIAASLAAASSIALGIPGAATPIDESQLPVGPQVSVTDSAQHTGPFAASSPLTITVKPGAPCVRADGYQESMVTRVLDDKGHQVWTGTFDESKLIGGTGLGTATFHVGSPADVQLSRQRAHHLPDSQLLCLPALRQRHPGASVPGERQDIHGGSRPQLSQRAWAAPTGTTSFGMVCRPRWRS